MHVKYDALTKWILTKRKNLQLTNKSKEKKKHFKIVYAPTSTLVQWMTVFFRIQPNEFWQDFYDYQENQHYTYGMTEFRM